MNKIYIIRALTNMHVGDGQANYGIVDNQVQRDALCEVPVIHASSLKGALLQYCKFQQKQGNVADADCMIKTVFGEPEMTGQYRFFDGRLLSIPVRGRQKPFYMATCPMIIQELLELADFLEVEIPFHNDLKEIKDLLPTTDNGGETKILAFTSEDTNDKIEGLPVHFGDCKFQNREALENVLGTNLVLFTDKEFKQYVQKLPVIARNKLENGESVNLWYEEIVPRESRFYFGLYQGEEFQTEFNKLLTEANYVQIGANATVGYGYTKIADICPKAGDYDA